MRFSDVSREPWKIPTSPLSLSISLAKALRSVNVIHMMKLDLTIWVSIEFESMGVH